MRHRTSLYERHLLRWNEGIGPGEGWAAERLGFQVTFPHRHWWPPYWWVHSSLFSFPERLAQSPLSSSQRGSALWILAAIANLIKQTQIAEHTVMVGNLQVIKNTGISNFLQSQSICQDPLSHTLKQKCSYLQHSLSSITSPWMIFVLLGVLKKLR